MVVTGQGDDAAAHRVVQSGSHQVIGDCRIFTQTGYMVRQVLDRQAK